LGLGALLRYPIQVGDVSERPKVQHSKCCLVKANVGSNPTVTAKSQSPCFPLFTREAGAFALPLAGPAVTQR
jgi:hypothetical protein